MHLDDVESYILCDPAIQFSKICQSCCFSPVILKGTLLGTEDAMFSLSELAPLNQHQNRSKLLKPWWEVFMDYLVVLMLMTSVLACTEQLSRDRVVCIPVDPLATTNTSGHNHSKSGNVGMSPSSKPPVYLPHNIGSNLNSAPRGRRTHLVYQQYIYISQVK